MWDFRFFNLRFFNFPRMDLTGGKGAPPPIQAIWMVSLISRGILGISREIPLELDFPENGFAGEFPGKFPGEFGWPSGEFPAGPQKFHGFPSRISREIPLEFPA